MEFRHTSVMPEETLEALAVKPAGTYVDCTLGGAGHAHQRRLSGRQHSAECQDDNGQDDQESNGCAAHWPRSARKVSSRVR